MAGQAAEWIGRDGTLKTGRNQLTELKEKQLRRHLYTCDVALQRCKECWLLYSNIGHEAYAAEVARATEAYNERGSE